MNGFEGRAVAVLGLARSGEAAARALLERGAAVTVLDATDDAKVRERAARLAGARVVLGRTDPQDLAGAGLIVTSPGIRPSSPWVAGAVASGVEVWSEIELAYRIGVVPAVAITGTNGKTTTTEMTVAALEAAGRRAAAAGNIGAPLADAPRDALVVAEVSSFQLQWIAEFRARIALLLNVARDHLDWHGGFEAYAAAKARIFENQVAGDTAVFHTSCAAYARGAGARVPFDEAALPAGGAGVEDGWIVVPQGRVVEVAAMRARGRANLADAVAAAAAACALGVDPAAAGRGIAGYAPKPHRIEPLGVAGGIAFVNDSKATDPHATLAALEGLDRVVLIAGGRNKGVDLGELAPAAGRLRAVVAIGEAAKEVEAALAPAGVRVEFAGTMEDAVRAARALAVEGDTVLLSPACASQDMFENYEARGEAFRAAVRRITGEDA